VLLRFEMKPSRGVVLYRAAAALRRGKIIIYRPAVVALI